MTAVLTRILIVVFRVLRTPLEVDPPLVVYEPMWRAHPGEKPNFPGYRR